jgi:hypothetical protein
MTIAPDRIKTPNEFRLTEFSRAFTSNLFSRMSGGASIPFALIGLWLGEAWQGRLFFALAGVCLILAAYFMWRKERERVDELSERVRPKLKCSFNMKDTACAVRGVTIQFVKSRHSPLPEGISITAVAMPDFLSSNRITADYFRLRVETDKSVLVEKCEGHLMAIECEGKSLLGEPVALPFAPSERTDALSRTIHEHVPAYLDVVAITTENKVIVTTRNHQRPSSVQQFEQMFAKAADYRLRLAIASDGPTVRCNLLFKWTGDPNTAECVYEPFDEGVWLTTTPSSNA